jgi:hypothetical protein
LISVPLFAIFGKSLPDVFKGLMEGRGLVLGPAPSNAPAQTSVPAAGASTSPFAQQIPYRASSDGNNASASAATPTNPMASNSAARSAASPKGFSIGDSAAAARPASFQAPSEAAPMGQDAFAARTSNGTGVARIADNGSPNANRVATEQSRLGNPAPDSSLSAARDGFGSGAGSNATADRLPNATTANNALAVSTSDEKFHNAERHLRELGATYYMLETWGADNNQYRFICKMAVGGNAGVNQFFQSTKDDPWRAMEDVLAQVEQWRPQSPR